MTVLYYDCFAGISGDMNLAALIDLGVNEHYLRTQLERLNLDGYQLKVSRDSRKGITGTRVDVLLQHEHEDESEHHHHHRTLKDIDAIIRSADYSQKVNDISLAIFQKIADAEAHIHGIPADQVHFHEVGAIDSIVDIVGAAICLDTLNVDAILSGPIELGGGFVTCAHGTFPVPAPATVEILKGIPARIGTVQYETTTPTGAAILAACVTRFTTTPSMTIHKTGYGIGHRDGDIPNVLRLFLGEMLDKERPSDLISESMRVIECSVDDMNPEWYEHAMDSLLTVGAADVFLSNIIMKKSRPGITITVIFRPDLENTVADILLRETTTIGLRAWSVDRAILPRAISTVTTMFGDVRVKSCSYNGQIIRSKPEYEDCKRLAAEHNVPISAVYAEVQRHLTVRPV